MIDEATKERLIAFANEILDNTTLLTNGAKSKITEDNFDSYRDEITCKCSYGATKLVFFPPDEDYIIKIPFNGYFMSEEEYIDRYCEKNKIDVDELSCDEYDELIQYISEQYGKATDDEIFIYHTGANNSKNGWDYCLTEVELSNWAIKTGVGDFFACTEFLFDYNGYPVYFQPKCDIEYYQSNFEVSEEEKRISRNILDDCFWSNLGINWISKALKFYGENLMRKFLGFLEANHIGDLHNENRGLFHGRPILVDYSGYNS